jgi:hypothetical protein
MFLQSRHGFMQSNTPLFPLHSGSAHLRHVRAFLGTLDIFPDVLFFACSTWWAWTRSLDWCSISFLHWECWCDVLDPDGMGADDWTDGKWSSDLAPARRWVDGIKVLLVVATTESGKYRASLHDILAVVVNGPISMSANPFSTWCRWSVEVGAGGATNERHGSWMRRDKGCRAFAVKERSVFTWRMVFHFV